MAVSFGSSVEVGKSDSVEFAGNRRPSSNYAWDITAKSTFSVQFEDGSREGLLQ